MSERIHDDDIQLPALCIRSLHDKIFEKKKVACREIEIMTKELNANHRTGQIKKLIEYFVKNFIDASSPNSKIGGLIAVSSVAIALDQNAKNYLEEIIKPVFSCTHDCHRDVRFRSLESLYNIVKCVRGSILIYLDEIFDIIIRLGEDNDVSIKEASLLMDRLLKDIVMVHKSAEIPQFNTISFISVIRERIYALSPNTRKLILSWINFLNSLPDVDLLIYIEDILDGLLKIACDNNIDIRQTAENILDDFFQNIKSNINSVEFRPLIKIILIHIQTDSQSVQSISLKWLDQFIKVSKENDILYNSAHILAVILPCLSCGFQEDEEHENDNYIMKINNELAKSINENLMNLITKTDLTNDNKREMLKQAGQNEFADEPFKISKILIVLLNELELGSKTSTPTKIAILEWIYQIYDHLTIEIDEELENKLVKTLLNTLRDSSDNVILLDIKAFCKIIFNDHEKERVNYRKLIKPLLDLFHTNSKLLENGGTFIIRQLCDIVDAQKFYITISQILLEYDKKFIRSMVYILNTILLTTKELGTIRRQLNNMMIINPSYQLFNFLYETWCYSSVSVISLCFLTKCYKLASWLILYFGKMEINIDILLEIDQLIQMLESPIFTSLRLDLLDPSRNYYLKKSLYGLLMLLPQSEAFHLLRKRLQCVPDFSVQTKRITEEEKLIHRSSNGTGRRRTVGRRTTAKTNVALKMDLEDKFAYYVHVQTSSIEKRIVKLFLYQFKFINNLKRKLFL